MISHQNNHGATDRVALIDVDYRLCPQLFSVLTDAGFHILGSLRSDADLEGIIRLRVRGSALPEECAMDPHLVTVICQVEAYGDQRLTRISDVILGRKLGREAFAA